MEKETEKTSKKLKEEFLYRGKVIMTTNKKRYGTTIPLQEEKSIDGKG